MVQSNASYYWATSRGSGFDSGFRQIWYFKFRPGDDVVCWWLIPVPIVSGSREHLFASCIYLLLLTSCSTDAAGGPFALNLRNHHRAADYCFQHCMQKSRQGLQKFPLLHSPTDIVYSVQDSCHKKMTMIGWVNEWLDWWLLASVAEVLEYKNWWVIKKWRIFTPRYFHLCQFALGPLRPRKVGGMS